MGKKRQRQPPVAEAEPAQQPSGAEPEHDDDRLAVLAEAAARSTGAGPGPGSVAYTTDERALLSSRANSALAPATVELYQTYRRQFEAWLSKHHPDVDIYTLDCSDCGDLLARFIKYQGDEEHKSVPVLRATRNALNNLFNHVNLVKGKKDKPALKDHSIFKKEFTTATRSCIGKGTRRKGKDPLAHTAADTYTPGQYHDLCAYLARHDDVSLGAVLAYVTMMHSGVGRSDDTRMFHLADMAEPVSMPTVGPCECLLFLLSLRGGKTDKNGRGQYMGFVRHADPMCCPIRALAQHVWARFTANNEPYPLPTDKDAWLELPMFSKSGDPTKPINYTQQYRQVEKAFAAVGINISKACHAFRGGAARMLDQLGLSADNICRLGRWLYDAVYQSYLVQMPPVSLLAAAGFDFNQPLACAFWSERFNVKLSDATRAHLTKAVYPFIDDLRAAVPQADHKLVSAKHNLAALEQLALVAIQDSLVMVDTAPENPLVKALLADAVFQELHQAFKADKASGVFERNKPKPQVQQVAEIHQNLAYMLEQVADLKRQNEALMEIISRLTNGGSPPAMEMPLAQTGMAVGLVLPPMPATQQPAQPLPALQQPPLQAQTLGVQAPAVAAGPVHRLALPAVQQPPPQPQTLGVRPPAMAGLQQHGTAVVTGLPVQPQQPVGLPPMPQKVGRQPPWCTTIKYADELWQEYDKGINGRPSLRALEEAYGTKWRKGFPQRWYERNTILEMIKETAAKRGHSCAATALYYGELQRRVPKISSIKALSKWAAWLRNEGKYIDFINKHHLKHMPTPVKPASPPKAKRQQLDRPAEVQRVLFAETGPHLPQPAQAAQLVLQAAQPLQQPAQPLQQPAQPLQQPAQPLQQPAQLPAALPAAQPAAAQPEQQHIQAKVKPKAPPNRYHLFSADFAKRMRDAGVAVNSSEMMVRAAEAWKAVDPEEKEEWRQKALVAAAAWAAGAL